jgi:hypothetical protein
VTIFDLKGYSRYVSDVDSDIVYEFTTGDYLEEGANGPDFAEINTGDSTSNLSNQLNLEIIIIPFLRFAKNLSQVFRSRNNLHSFPLPH